MNKIITPTVSRSLWYWPSSRDLAPSDEVSEKFPLGGRGLHCAAPDQPFDAKVILVHGDRCVTLLVTDHFGKTIPVRSVTLVQAGDEKPDGAYAEWMPYQVGQAKKDEAAPSEPIRILGAAAQLSAAPDPIEAEIVAKGLTAPRVTPDDLEAEVVSEHYFTAWDGAQLAYWGDSDPESPKPASGEPQKDGPLSLLTFCVLGLKNGFTLVGKSACASPENFNAELGRKIARKDAIEQLWPLLGFRLRDQLAAANRV